MPLYKHFVVYERTRVGEIVLALYTASMGLFSSTTHDPLSIQCLEITSAEPGVRPDHCLVWLKKLKKMNQNKIKQKTGISTHFLWYYIVRPCSLDLKQSYQTKANKQSFYIF